MQTDAEARVLPSGWFHATLTLLGCFVPGIQFTVAKSLVPAAIVLIMEDSYAKPPLGPFFNATSAAMEFGQVDEAVQVMFDALKGLHKPLHPEHVDADLQMMIPKMTKARPGKCPGCGKKWQWHGGTKTKCFEVVQ